LYTPTWSNPITRCYSSHTDNAILEPITYCLGSNCNLLQPSLPFPPSRFQNYYATLSVIELIQQGIVTCSNPHYPSTIAVSELLCNPISNRADTGRIVTCSNPHYPSTIAISELLCNPISNRADTRHCNLLQPSLPFPPSRFQKLLCNPISNRADTVKSDLSLIYSPTVSIIT
jgi:hypothetical protein